MSAASRNSSSKQTELDQRADSLEAEADQLDSVLNQHDDGWMNEEEVLEYGRKANRAYDELVDFEEGILDGNVDLSRADTAKSRYDEVTDTAARDYGIEIPEPEKMD